MKLHKKTSYLMSDTNGVALCGLFSIIPFPRIFNHKMYLCTCTLIAVALQSIYNDISIKMVEIDHELSTSNSFTK